MFIVLEGLKLKNKILHHYSQQEAQFEEQTEQFTTRFKQTGVKQTQKEATA